MKLSNQQLGSFCRYAKELRFIKIIVAEVKFSWRKTIVFLLTICKQILDSSASAIINVNNLFKQTLNQVRCYIGVLRWMQNTSARNCWLLCHHYAIYQLASNSWVPELRGNKTRHPATTRIFSALQLCLKCVLRKKTLLYLRFKSHLLLFQNVKKILFFLQKTLYFGRKNVFFGNRAIFLHSASNLLLFLSFWKNSFFSQKNATFQSKKSLFFSYGSKKILLIHFHSTAHLL